MFFFFFFSEVNACPLILNHGPSGRVRHQARSPAGVWSVDSSDSSGLFLRRSTDRVYSVQVQTGPQSQGQFNVYVGTKGPDPAFLSDQRQGRVAPGVATDTAGDPRISSPVPASASGCC